MISFTGLSPSWVLLSRSFNYQAVVSLVKTVLRYNPHRQADEFELFPFRSPLLRKYSPTGAFFLFLQVLRCFTSLGELRRLKRSVTWICHAGFPHSDISGSSVTRHLPEAYRRRVTSFIASQSRGIHHTPLQRSRRNCVYHNSASGIKARQKW